MEWVAENGGGRGLTRNRGGETSPAAKKVWDRFDAVHREPGSKVKADHSADPMWPEYTSHSGELKQVRTREVKLTKEQADLAWDVLTGLNIGDRPGRAERRGWRSAPGGAR